MGKYERWGIVRELRRNREIVRSDIVEVTLIGRDDTEDWALLQRCSGKFGVGNYCTNIILDEDHLPATSSKVFIFDYPFGVLTAPTGCTKLQCDVFGGHVRWYESPKTGTDSSSTTVLSTWRVVESLEEDDPETRVVVEGGRFRGSGGAPYVTYSGALFAFHVASFNDEENASRSSHTHYSSGIVFSRSPEFLSAYGRLHA